jgi:orotidine-5'-phosphate decarboxylase
VATTHSRGSITKDAGRVVSMDRRSALGLKSPIVFALDFASVAEAEEAALRVRDALGMVKVGLELFVEAGPRAVGIGEACGLPVFLDLKLCDIPETVERAVGRAASLGARVLTVHATGGPAMLGREV